MFYITLWKVFEVLYQVFFSGPFSGSKSACFVVIRAALETTSRQCSAVPYIQPQSTMRVNNEIFLQVFLQSFFVIHFDNHTNGFAGKQSLSCLPVIVGLIPFAIFFNLSVWKAFHHFMCKLGNKCLVRFALGNKNSHLYTFFWNLLGGERETRMGLERSGVASSICMNSLSASCSALALIWSFQFWILIP